MKPQQLTDSGSPIATQRCNEAVIALRRGASLPYHFIDSDSPVTGNKMTFQYIKKNYGVASPVEIANRHQ